MAAPAISGKAGGQLKEEGNVPENVDPAPFRGDFIDDGLSPTGPIFGVSAAASVDFRADIGDINWVGSIKGVELGLELGVFFRKSHSAPLQSPSIVANAVAGVKRGNTGHRAGP
jgi:hypothetical protein